MPLLVRDLTKETTRHKVDMMRRNIGNHQTHGVEAPSILYPEVLLMLVDGTITTGEIAGRILKALQGLEIDGLDLRIH